MPFDTRNIGGRDAVIEELALHQNRMGRIKATINTQNKDHMKWRRKGKKLNMVQSSGRREHQWCAAVEPRDDINYTYHKVAKVKGSVDHQNSRPNLSSRLQKNREARRTVGSATVQREHKARLRNMNRRIGDYATSANEQKKKPHITDFDPALLMRKEGDIAIITGSGMPDMSYRWQTGGATATNESQEQIQHGTQEHIAAGNIPRKRGAQSANRQRPQSAAPATSGDKCKHAYRSGSANQNVRRQKSRPRSATPNYGHYRHSKDPARTRSASGGTKSAVHSRIQRRLVDEIVSRRLFRAQDLEAFFASSIAAASPTEKSVMPLVIEQLQRELELS
jgi:hypothetical protein